MPYVGAPKDFDRIAKEFHVDYAFHKVSPGHYLLFFKANQADVITAAFQKYSAKVLNKEQDKASILGQLRNFFACLIFDCISRYIPAAPARLPSSVSFGNSRSKSGRRQRKSSGPERR